MRMPDLANEQRANAKVNKHKDSARLQGNE